MKKMMFKGWMLICIILCASNLNYAQYNSAGTGVTTNKFVLPEPNGKYQVGRFWTSVTDVSRQNREIPLFIYYPVKSGKSADNFVIPTEEWREQYLPLLKKKLGEDAGNLIAFNKAKFQENQPTAKGKFPLILFSPGMNWSTLEYSYLLQELVSEGYIVAAVNSAPLAPVLQTPTGKFINAENPKDKYQLAANDLLFVLKQFEEKNAKLQQVTNQTDINNVALMGHSLGGAAALLAATNNKKIKATVNMDGDMLDASLAAAPNASVLFLNQIPAEFENLSFADMKKDADRGWRYEQMAKATANSAKGIYVSIAGMYHSNFQDYALLPVHMIPDNIRKFRLGPIDGKSCLQLIDKTLISFMNEELKGKQTDWVKLDEETAGLRVINTKL